MIKFIYLNFLLIIFLNLMSCAGGEKSEKKDTTELWNQSQTQGDIIARSGTTFSSGSDKDLANALDDAQNRLRTGGGMLGKKPTDIGSLFNKNSGGSVASIGMPINPYFWRASLETIDFLPILSADPFAGIIITDWYSVPDKKFERCKLNIFIKGINMSTNNLKVNSFCQKNIDGNWINEEMNLEDNRKIENAIFNKAKKIKLAQS